MSKEVLTISEAAKILGVSDETLRIWEKAGKITPSYTEGKHRRYQKIDIENLPEFISNRIKNCYK